MWRSLVRTEAEEHGRRAAAEDGGDSRAHPHEDEDIDGARIRVYIYSRAFACAHHKGQAGEGTHELCTPGDAECTPGTAVPGRAVLGAEPPIC